LAAIIVNNRQEFKPNITSLKLMYSSKYGQNMVKITGNLLRIS